MVLVTGYVQQKRVQFVKAKLKPVSDFSVASFYLPNFNLFGLNLANRLRDGLLHETKV